MNAPAGSLRARKAKPTYATRTKVRAAIEIARECGLDVAGFELSPDGVIRIVEARALPKAPQTDFDRFESEL